MSIMKIIKELTRDTSKRMKNEEVAKEFNISKNGIINIFMKLEFIERREKGLFATRKGVLAGATDNKYMGKNYILWKEKILENEELKNNILPEKQIKQKTTYQEKVQKGRDYEVFVGKYFEQKEYIVKFNGIENGVKDNSVDVIAINKEEIIFIQCKNWKEEGRKIKHIDIKAFLGDIYVLITENKNYQGYKEKRLFVASNEIFDNSAIKYCEEHKELVDYLHLPME